MKAYMKKTDKLVADALEIEFKRYCNSELQCIRAVNEGHHGDLKPLPEPTEDLFLDAFKGQRFSH